MIRQAEVLPKGSHGVSVGLDRTTVPMESPKNYFDILRGLIV